MLEKILLTSLICMISSWGILLSDTDFDYYVDEAIKIVHRLSCIISFTIILMFVWMADPDVVKETPAITVINTPLSEKII